MAYVNVAEWKPEQVTEWLKGLDNCILTYVHSFLNNEVNGQQLLNIRPDDLDHLGVQKLGHQELILEAVEHLRNFHYELDRENLQLLALRLSCRARSLFRELVHHEDSEPVSTQTLADVASIMTTVKPIACWLGRSPFAGHSDYHHRKISLLNLSLEIATCAHRDRFAERPVEEIRKSCDQLASLADSIIHDIQDPLLLQPASLDLATVKKKAGEDLGVVIQPSFHGIHQISELKFSFPAQQCGKIEEGDEVVQVNYQTVVGWQSKKVMFLLEESLTDVFLTLKKRPRHTKVYGQIYIKPYRLPSKKRATPYTRWHENLPSPRPELLTIPDFEIPLPRSSPKQGMAPPATEHLIDTEPLACSSSSGDDDEDDGAFLPGVADLAQASPTSMRLYLPKQRSSVQRRATVTGASPTSRRPPINIEQFWRELQLQHQFRGVGNNSSLANAELCQLRDKSHGISSSLVSVNDMLRPSTCLGIEQSLNNSFNLNRSKYSKEINSESPIEGNNKEENFMLMAKSFKEVAAMEGKIQGLKSKGTELDVGKVKVESLKCENHVPSVNSTETSTSPIEEKPKIFSLETSDDTNSNNIFSHNLSSGVKNYSKVNYSDNACAVPIIISSDASCEEAGGACASDNIKLINYPWAKGKDKVQQYPIDESALKIPYGNVKYIDDTSDSYLNKDYMDENDFQLTVDSNVEANSAAITNRLITNENTHKNSNFIDHCISSSECHNKSYEEYCYELDCNTSAKIKTHDSSDCNRGKTASNLDYSNTHVFNFMEEKKSYNTEESSTFRSNHTNKSNTLELPRKNVQPKHFISVKNKIEPKKSVNLLAGASNNTSGNVNTASGNTSYRNKLAQSLGQLGGTKSLSSTMCSPKSLKRRNHLLAKRRNVNPKELSPADCEGWLLHRCRWNGSGASLGTWTRAWFVLKGSIFYGFKSPHASKANIMISLPGFTVSVAEEVKSKKFAFKVYHTGTVFYFAAESEQFLAMWLESITSGTIAQDIRKSLYTDDIFFSETEEDSEPEVEVESGTCFPNRKTYKFSNILGGGSSPTASRSQQNLSSETKFGQEVQKKFGSLKKLGRKVTDGSVSSPVSHSDGSGSSSLDRKYLCFLGSSRNNTLPVPTDQFRSYRRVPNTPSSKMLNDSSQKGRETLCKGDSTKEIQKKSCYGISHTRAMQTMESTKQPQEKVRSINYSNLMSAPNHNVDKIKDNEYCNPVPYKSENSDRFLRPFQIGDLRERSTHASNPTLQLAGDLSDYRLAAERLREFNMQRNRQREDTSGFVTLEKFMLSRQEEERKSQTLRHRKIQDERSEVHLIADSHTLTEVKKGSSFNASDYSNKSFGSTKENSLLQNSNQDRAGSDNITSSLKLALDSRLKSNQLKSVAQYQPPPVSQLEDGQALTLAFEMHFGEKESNSAKPSKFRNIFGSKSNRHHVQKQSLLEVPTPETVEPRQKTILGSPRLHRAIFREKHYSANKGGGNSKDSNCSSLSSPASPPVLSLNEWSMENTSDLSPSQSKPTMGISMLGKRPTRRSPLIYPQVQSVSPPDYPGLEYPPVFEPETYTLADASSLRSRPRNHSEKHS